MATEEAFMRSLAQGLDEVVNPGKRGKDKTVGFVLLVYPIGAPEGARCNYVSNGADRRDIVALMKEMIARFEGQPETRGRA